MADANSTSISSISPNRAPFGALIHVEGTIATVDGEYRICWNNPEAKPLVAGRAKGNKVTETISVPNVDCGEHHLILMDLVTKDSGGLKFTVIPSLTMQPDSGPAGTTVNMKGANFPPGQVSINYDGKEVAKATSSARKTFHIVFQVPAGPGGEHEVTSDPAATSQSFHLTPAIILDPDSGTPGTEVTIRGTGFGPGPVSLIYGGNEVASATPDDQGGFRVSFTVPEGEAGEYDVTTSPASIKETFTLLSRRANTISVQPDSGTAGSQITVKGENFKAEEEVALLFGGTQVATLWTDNKGDLLATFEVASMPGGSYVIASLPPSTEVAFNMLPGVSIEPATGPVGTEIEVRGAGFRPRGKIAVCFDGEEIVTTELDEGGSFVAGLVVPQGASGMHLVTTSPASEDRAFTITPTISIDPARGPAGTNISIRGNGFPAGGLVGLKYDGRDAAKATAGKDGSFQARMTASVSTTGVHQITTDPPSTEEDFITPQIAAEPLTGPVGTEVRLSGSGFAPEQRVSIRYDDKEVAGAVADSQGYLKAAFNVWACSAGEHRISTEPAASEQVFTLIPSMFLEPETGPVGSEVKVGGRGFTPTDVVDIRFGSKETVRVVVDVNGSFCHTLAVPASAGGKHSISAGPPLLEQPFIVVPSLIVEPGTGPVGTEARIQVCGFEPGAEATVKYDSQELTALVPDSDGNNHCTVRIPPSCLGDHRLVTSPASIDRTFNVTPAVILTPSSGPTGTPVDVRATGFLPNDKVRILFDDMEMCLAATDENGNAETSFEVPAGLGGRHLVCLQQTMAPPVQATFDVVPKLSISRDTGHVGLELKVAVTGLGAGRRTSIIFDNKEVAAAIADNTGSLESSFALPSCVAGQHKVFTEPPSSQELFEVLPVMAIRPAAGVVGSEVEVDGTGFEAGREVSICYDGKEVATAMADRSGNIHTGFTVPACTGGEHKIGSEPTSSESVFDVRPSFTLESSSGPVGTEVFAAGTGFPAGKRISIRLNSAEIAIANADHEGSFREAFSIPEAPTGAHRITTEPYSTVVAFELLPHFTLEPLEGTVGLRLQMTGTGFMSGKRISLRYDDREIGTTISGAKGSFQVELLVPPGGAGKHRVSTEPPSVDETFVVAPDLSARTSGGLVGSEINVSGSGFVPGKRVSVRYDDMEAVVVTAAHDGGFDTGVMVPASAAGEHRIVTEPPSGELIYTVSPSLKITPDRGFVRTEIMVEGNGFPSGCRVSLNYDGMKVLEIDAGSHGSFQGYFATPPSTVGVHRIGSDPACVEEVFQVAPRFSLSPQWGFAHNEIKFQGTGFDKETRLSINYDDQPVAATVTDRDGSVNAVFLIPASITGEHRITTDPPSHDMSVTVVPKIEMDTIHGTVGTDVKVHGSGFPGNRRISIRYDDKEVAIVAADDAGSFEASFCSPASMAGEHKVTTAPPSMEKVFTISPNIRIEPLSGLVGTETLVSGNGFPAGGRVRILYDRKEVAEVIADASGGFQSKFSIPNSGRGRHEVSTDPPAIVEGFNVLSTISVNPAGGPVGTRLEVEATGFPSDERVFVRYDDREITTLVAGSDGSFRTAIIIPPSLAGRHILTTDPVSVEREFSVTPSFAIYPDSGLVGTEITLVGTGFPSGTVAVRYDADRIMVAAADSKGNFEAFFPVVPGVAGEHYVTTQPESVSRSFAVTPKIYLDRFSGTAGSEVNVRGTGFPSGHVAVKYDYKEIAMARADERGDLQAAFKVPPGIAGEYRVITVPSSSVETFELIPQITLVEPGNGTVGTPVTIQGENFVPGRKVSVMFDGVEAVTAFPDRDGDFQALFTVPLATGGKHELTTDPASTQEVFHMVSRLVTEPATGPVGAELTVTGTGFEQGVVSIRFDGTHVATVLVDERGSFRSAFNIPAAIAGEHRVTTSQMRVSQA